VAVALSFLMAATLAGLLLLLPVTFDGVVVIIVLGFLWFGLFFMSYPLQRRFARSLDLRRPGISLVGGILVVPLTKEAVLRFNLDEPHELRFGWCEHVLTSVGSPTKNTRAVWTHATVSQTGRELFLIAEDAIREAQSAGWPESPDASKPATPRVRLWASDLVELVEAIKSLAPAH
jgi:hypothetical protein